MVQLALPLYPAAEYMPGVPGEVAAELRTREGDFRALWRLGATAAEFADLARQIGARCGRRPIRSGSAPGAATCWATTFAGGCCSRT